MIIKAKYALLAPEELRTDVCLLVDGNRITDVISGYSPRVVMPDYDLGLAVITPGFVNAHAHLELEFCAGQIDFDGNFINWLQAVRDAKRARGNRLSFSPRESLRKLMASGCTTVYDHHTVDMNWDVLENFGPRYVGFHEFFMFNNHNPPVSEMSQQVRHSTAPHAPYTASLEVARACREIADERGYPLSIHLAEIPEELEFIQNGRSETIRNLLAMAKAEDPEFAGTGRTAIRLYTDEGILTPQTLAVHMAYLGEGDMELVSEIKPTIVYCPRSHAYFSRDAHPLERYLEAGIPVALGTDSLASNRQLSMLYEAALVRQLHPEVAAADVFRMLTTAGHRPLGNERSNGMLEPGCIADLAVFPLESDPGQDFTALFDAILNSGGSLMTMVGGRVCLNRMEQAQLAV